jgi:hypothetical protein
LGNNIPSARGSSPGESLGEEDVDVGFGWASRDLRTRTYVNSGRVFLPRADVFRRDFNMLHRFKSYPRNYRKSCGIVSSRRSRFAFLGSVWGQPVAPTSHQAAPPRVFCSRSSSAVGLGFEAAFEVAERLVDVVALERPGAEMPSRHRQGWSARWKDHEGKRRRMTFRFRRDAEMYERKMKGEQEEIRRGLRGLPPPPKPFEDLCGYWCGFRAT